ncbi:MAG: hypothetical protein DI551_05935 [Micavibrio aeruginosavorus]|uniref:Uncharacterized protein n=1 Tax=Micavibrio aeruginosavorus TaxID=349221 RepID=A0A2W5PMW6_9BACT|nr:MAG: hypothetical protein DI551_05935 [Micavibrio aeruginosavorus]
MEIKNSKMLLDHFKTVAPDRPVFREFYDAALKLCTQLRVPLEKSGSGAFTTATQRMQARYNTDMLVGRFGLPNEIFNSLGLINTYAYKPMMDLQDAIKDEKPIDELEAKLSASARKVCAAFYGPSLLAQDIQERAKRDRAIGPEETPFRSETSARAFARIHDAARLFIALNEDKFDEKSLADVKETLDVYSNRLKKISVAMGKTMTLLLDDFGPRQPSAPNLKAV